MMEKRRSGAELMGEAIKKFRLGVIVAKYVDILLKFLYVLWTVWMMRQKLSMKSMVSKP